MGYLTSMYGVNLAELERIIREKDPSILEIMHQATPYVFHGDHYLPVRQAIASILDGNANQVPSDAYPRAFEVIIEALGVSLPDEEAIGFICGLELNSPLGGAFRCPVEFEITSDWPFITYLTSDEVRLEADRLEKMDIGYPEDWGMNRARRGYANSIFEAAKQGLAIVTFCS